MAVNLLPPLTSGYDYPKGAEPLTVAPRYVRTLLMSRWHRTRCGYRNADGKMTLHIWCNGGSVVLGSTEWSSRLGVGVDDVPQHEPVCGVCVGKALGAQQDEQPAGLPLLRFDPRHLTPPSKCPGSRSRELWKPLNAAGNVGQCLVCGDPVPVRAIGRGYDAYGAGPVQHSPGDGLFPACPWHAWQLPALRADGTVGCSCGWGVE